MTTATLHERKAINFDPRYLMVPALLCLWVLPFITFSEPEDWRASQFGTAPILPPPVIKAIKILGRGGTIGIMCFSLLSVWVHEKRGHVLGIMAPLLLFGAFGMFSTVWSPLKSISLMQSGTFVMLLLVSIYIAVVWKSDQDTERLVKHLALAIFCLSVALIILHFGMPRSGALTKRAAGVLHSTNACAAAGLGILLTLAGRLLWRTPWSIWWFPIIATEVSLILVAGNRLSFIITATVVVLFLALVVHRGYAALLIFVASICVSGYFVVDPGLELFKHVGKNVGVYVKQGQTKAQIRSVSGRAEMWEKIWNSYTESPVVGHGYFVSSKNGRIYVWYEWGNWTAHNVILQTLVTTGIVGFTLLLLGLLSLFIGVMRGMRTLDGISNSITLLGVIGIWYLGWGFLNSSIVGPLQPESVVFAVMVGIAAGIGASAHLQLFDRREIVGTKGAAA